MGDDVAADEDGAALEFVSSDDSAGEDDLQQGVLGGVKEGVELVAFG
jgi:hypothetical protein